jgi:hypothetical protein
VSLVVLDIQKEQISGESIPHS